MPVAIRLMLKVSSAGAVDFLLLLLQFYTQIYLGLVTIVGVITL